MPQVDLETLVSSVCSGGSEHKIACETLAEPTHKPEIRPDDVTAVATPDFPPESYSLSDEAQLEWLNQNAFFERKESQKGNSTSTSANLNPNLNSNSNSHRISLKPKASIIGLPKPQKTCFTEAKNRRNCRIARTLMIPKRVGSRLKTDPSLTEPSSPKVSCMGRVRSKRDRSRRTRRQKSGRSDPLVDKPKRIKKPGFFASFRAIFRAGGGCKDISASTRGTHAQPRIAPTTSMRDIRSRLPPEDTDAASVSSPPRFSAGSRRSFDEPVRPGLGGMKRFASGRKTDLLVDADVA